MEYRTGFGYDIHKLKKGRKLILGGVEIKHPVGLDGHSDADVLLHAICDALLGAAGFKDIGNQFPNTDKKYKDISSLILLKNSFKLLTSKKWKVVNLDCMVILEEPKIYKYTEQMKKNISEILKTKNISIKATTSEGLGFVGEKKGCVAYATVMLKK
ncbi:MAG TPA: 2-C-methyl-D-erythritol 2,4-cyclodiphosphate synthase [Bacteroidetes bacterium]|nr:2-C-methyl-D-erythritol 2,4-cyclodiphosphate synthase [Ignavibacteria bacterium]HCA43845.1 2-C-methyl-D-erythritol 2,4-cyclodiphosphate synthase [Bacteroidota bacterium]HCN38371.1 2-C-methyl-D-erythritol 2,4-cyclodiphosphate synthase [Bacteroidota bacterium]